MVKIALMVTVKKSLLLSERTIEWYFTFKEQRAHNDTRLCTQLGAAQYMACNVSAHSRTVHGMVEAGISFCLNVQAIKWHFALKEQRVHNDTRLCTQLGAAQYMTCDVSA